jgi:hypothetical protein
MVAVLVVFLSVMVIAYALVALATVKIWRFVPHCEVHDEDRPERLVDGGGGRTSKHRCSEAAHRSPARGRVRRSHRRRRY